MRVIHQTNHGVGITRQVALDASKGDYVAFADAADWTGPKWLEKLYRKIVAYNADMVICGP